MSKIEYLAINDMGFVSFYMEYPIHCQFDPCVHLINKCAMWHAYCRDLQGLIQCIDILPVTSMVIGIVSITNVGEMWITDFALACLQTFKKGFKTHLYYNKL